MKKITLTDAELDYCNAEGIPAGEFAKAKTERLKTGKRKMAATPRKSGAGGGGVEYETVLNAVLKRKRVALTSESTETLFRLVNWNAKNHPPARLNKKP